MLKYIVEAVTRLQKLKSGIVKNPTVWTGQAVTPETIQTTIDGLDKVEKESEDLQSELSSKHVEARNVSAAAEKEAGSITNLAIGLEKGNQEKLSTEYGISMKKEAAQKSAPVTPLHIALQDDTDGIGYIVSTQKDQSADNYEWHKGQGANPADTNTIPEMKFFKYTSKTTFVDDDVAKGVRYFYRVRAVNTAGVGAWSEAVSRVQ